MPEVADPGRRGPFAEPPADEAWPARLPSVDALRLLIQLHGLRETSSTGLRWLLHETEPILAGELWQTCQSIAEQHAPQDAAASPRLRFPRELLLAVGDEDPNDLVHPVLIPLCAAFLDRGQASFAMPGRREGFFAAWRHVALAGRALRPEEGAELLRGSMSVEVAP